MPGRVSEYFGRFPKVFWVAMSFELFERGAYYSFTPIIAIHAWANVGAPLWLSAMIFTFIWPIQYGLPILSGALVEKVGYRKQIFVAFIILTVAYIMLSRATTTTTMILSVMALGFGIGTYKPLISAIVAKVTTSKDRNVAFGIYYVIVNAAAALFPVGFYMAELQGWIRWDTYHIIFMVGGILVSLNIFIALFLFEDIPKSKKVKTIGDALNNIKISMKDKKFMVLVLLVAGFWALYSSQLTGVIIIFYGYRWNPIWFTPILYAIFNPMTIVLIGSHLSKYIEKVESIRVMLAGFLVYIIGLIILGYGIADWRTLVIGLIIMSFGEFMVAPGFYSFTSKLATEDKVSAYIGSTFVASFIGLALGSTVLGLYVAYVAETLQMPYFFFGSLLSVSLLLFVGFLLYYQKWGQDVIERAWRIAEKEEGKKREVDADYVEPMIFRLYETKVPILISLILIPIVLFSTFSMGTFTFYGPPGDDEIDVDVIPIFYPADYDVVTVSGDSTSGTLGEGGSTSETFTTNRGEGEVVGEGEFLKSVTFSLSWTDEPDPVLRTNLPDVFEIVVTHDDGWTKTLWAQNPQGESYTINLDRELDHDYVNSTSGIGDWDIEITLLNAGDYTAGPRDREVQTDNGNDYSLEISVEIYTKAA